MKVIYLHQYFTTPSMSGGTRSYEMAKRIVAAGHEVHMVTSDRESSGKPYRTTEAGIDVTWIPVPYSNHMGTAARIRAFFDFAWKSARIAASLEGDVVFASSTPLTIALPAVYASKRKRIPMVFEVRDLWPETPIALGALKNPLARIGARQLERFAYRNASRIVALSPGMRDGVVSTGYPSEHVSVIPNASDLEEFAVDESVGRAFRGQYAWLQDRPLVVYAGTIGFANNIGYMARLADEVSRVDPDVRFLVLGTGKEEEAVRNLAKELGVLHRNFFMLPPMPRQDLTAVLSAADLASSFVIDRNAMWHNSANKFFNALAASTPIIINHEGWQADLIREHDVGLVLDANDVADAATRLVGGIRNRQWLDRAGQAARKLGEDRFDRERLAAELERVLCRAVERSESQATKGAMLA